MKRILPATLLAATLTLAACGSQAPPAQAPAEVAVVQARPEAVPLQRDFVGRLAATRIAEVRARVPGIVQERAYREGSDVAAGDTLFHIDPAPLQASLAAQQAQLAQAQANAVNAARTAERYRELGARRLIARQDQDTAEAQARSTAAARQQAQANVRQAQLELGYTSVVAPIAGRAGKAQVTEGALVGQGEATLLTRVEQIDPIYVDFSQSAADLQALQRAQAEGRLELSPEGDIEVAVHYPDGTAYPLPGRLNFADLAVDPATGAVALRALVPNPDRRLLPGMFVRLKLTLGRTTAYAVPQTAVQRDAQGAYVLVVGADAKVAQKRVTAGEMRGDRWIVSAGLAEGDRVIASGVQKASVGATVKPVPWQSQVADKAPNAGAAQADAGRR